MRPPFSEADKQTIAQFVQEGWGIGRLSKHAHCRIRTMKRLLAALGLHLGSGFKRQHFKPSEVLDIVARYQGGESAPSIGSSFGCSEQPIRRLLKEQCVPTRRYTDTAEMQRVKKGFLHIPPEIFKSWRARAGREGHAWQITIHDLEAQFTRQNGRCTYTQLSMLHSNHRETWFSDVKGRPTAMSLDRLDSSQGYTRTNVVLCCRIANLAKNAWDERTFRDTLNRVVTSLSPRCGLQSVYATEDSLTS